MEENEAQSKQAEDESVFFRFGDGRAMHANAQVVCLRPRPRAKNRPRSGRPVAVISVLRIGSEEVGQVKVSNRLVRHYRRPNPVNGYRAAAIVQLAAANPRPDVIPVAVVDIV